MLAKVLNHIIFVFSFVILISSCRDEQIDNPTDPGKISPVKGFDAEVTLQWYKLFLEVDRFAPGYRPPAAARMLGYVGLAAYEAVVPGMPDFKSIAYRYEQLTLPALETKKEYHWPTVLNSVYYHSFKKYFPHIAPIYEDKINAMGARFLSTYGLKISQDIMERSELRGLAIADAFYDWSASDPLGHYGFKNPQPSDYTAPKGPGKWQATPPDFGKALFPYWGKVRPFALRNDELLGRPYQYYVGEFSEDAKSQFHRQAMEVYAITTPLVLSRQWVGEFWSDDIYEQTFESSARWISIANQVIEEHKSDLETAVFLNAKLGMALADAAIAVWNTKYTYNVERPVSYINRLIDPAWKPTLNNPVNGLKGVTPSFPAYPSDHSGFGGAGAGILNTFYGKDYSMTDKSHALRTEFNGLPRTFNSFDDMAKENAVSRIYLGVHFRMDTDEGLELGYKAAEKVNSLPWKN